MHKNLRIIPEVVAVDLNGSMTVGNPLTSHGNHLLLDPRTMHTPEAFDEAIAFHNLDYMGRITWKIAEQSSAMNNDTMEKLIEAFPRGSWEKIKADWLASGVNGDDNEKDAAAVTMLRNAGIYAIIKENIPNLLKEEIDSYEKNIAQFEENLKVFEQWKMPPPIDFRPVIDLNRSTIHALQLGPDALQRMEHDEAAVADAFDALPQHIKQAFLIEPTTIAVTQRPISLMDCVAQANPHDKIIYLSRNTLNDRDELIRTLKEEILHCIDVRLKFTDRPEWKEAVFAEIRDMTPDRLAIIEQALHGKKCIFKEDEVSIKAAFSGDSFFDMVDEEERTQIIEHFAPGSYHTDQAKCKELLVDYFHVRDDLAARSSQPLGPEALAAEMQRLFPHTHQLCQKFEEEMMQLARSHNRGRGPN